MTVEVSDIATPDLVTETDVDGKRIEVRLVGSAEAFVVGDLIAYLDAVHRVAVEADASEIVLDIRGLEFISAACLASMLVWLRQLQRGPACRPRFVWDAKKHWQRRTLDSLVTFAGELVRTE